jgi:glycosyltransferase involved in cell wall biosynthesis
MKSICIIGQFPPPIHGLSKAIETLYNSHLKNKYLFHKIDITNNKNIFKNLWKILISHDDLYYFTISQTKGGNWRDLLILKLIECKKRKCIIHLHGGYYRQLIEKDCGNLQRRLNYALIKKLDGCIVLGNMLQSIFKDMIDSSKIFTVPNCVDNEYLLPQSLIERKIDNLENNATLHILYLSNFIESKGFKDVLNLAVIAKNAKKNLHFHFAGKFYKEEDHIFTQNFIQQNQLQEYVTFHGIVFGKNKNELLQQCHIFILPTRYPNEGQPISILEAMGNAMNIITTNHAGIPDITKDKVNGLVVDKNNINLNEIYDYIQYLNQNRNVLQSIASTNYQTAITQYTEAQYISNLDRVFQIVLNK